MVDFINRLLHPTAETTKIPEAINAAMARSAKANTAALQAVEDLLAFMERPRENRDRSTKE